jgi:Right handed beta helix region
VSRSNRFGARRLLIAAIFVVGLVGASPARGGGRDDTDWLQAQLDAGGNVVLPKLPNGACYASRGLWVSHDDTSITSDGACIVALGPGAARIRTGTGRPVRATAVFFINHSDIFKPLPVRISISGLRIVVPDATRMDGVAVSGHEVTLDHLTIGGAPMTDVLVGGGKPASAAPTERIIIRDSTLTGGRRDVISVAGPIGLRVERNTLAGARGIPKEQAAAGLHIRAADRGQPTLDVHALGNTITDNAGPGIFVDLDPANGAPVLASGIELSGNIVLRNARAAPASRRAGIVIAGGQDDGNGRLTLMDNVVRGNRGPGILGRKLRLVVDSARNDLRGNRGGGAKGLHTVAPHVDSPGPRFVPPASPAGVARDDTDWFQRRLDARGDTIFLPKLPNGECYAVRGLWVSHDDTTITSDGACIVSLGPGEDRLKSVDGDPIVSSGVFFVNRSSPKKPAPVHITISNLRIIVPSTVSMYGVVAAGHDVTLDHLDISGYPRDDVLIGGRANGNGYVGNVSVLNSTLSEAKRNAVSAFGVIGLRIEGNTIEGVRDSPPGQPAAGIDVEPDDRGQPTLGVRIVRNTIQDNAGPGILLELDSNSGAAMIATDLEIRGNTILRNARKPSPPKRAGVVLAGGQDGGAGTLILKDNVIRGNGGPGILETRLKLVVQASNNDLAGNDGGPSSNL